MSKRKATNHPLRISNRWEKNLRIIKSTKYAIAVVESIALACFIGDNIDKPNNLIPETEAFVSAGILYGLIQLAQNGYEHVQNYKYQQQQSIKQSKRISKEQRNTDRTNNKISPIDNPTKVENNSELVPTVVETKPNKREQRLFRKRQYEIANKDSNKGVVSNTTSKIEPNQKDEAIPITIIPEVAEPNNSYLTQSLILLKSSKAFKETPKEIWEGAKMKIFEMGKRYELNVYELKPNSHGKYRKRVLILVYKGNVIHAEMVDRSEFENQNLQNRIMDKLKRIQNQKK